MLTQTAPASRSGSHEGKASTSSPVSARLVMAVVVVYVLGVIFVDTDAHLLTDVGGKTASMAAMVEGGDWDPDIGYWLEGSDPAGRFHPIAKTSLTDRGSWINTTSLTMLVLARPLWDIGGPQLALAIPALGALATAFAGASLHRRLYPTHSPNLAFATVALGSPVLIYAFDFWEHSWGAALITAGVASIVRLLDGQEPATPMRYALLAGAAYGIAATMRQEALVFGFVAGVVLSLASLQMVGVAAALKRSILFGAGAICPFVAHGALESALTGSASRANRGVQTLATAGGGGLQDQLSAAWAMLGLGFPTFDPFFAYLSGFTVVTGLLSAIVLVRGAPRAEHQAIRLLTLGWAAWLVAFLSFGGPAFVPGVLIAAPIVVFGVVGTCQAHRLSTTVLLLGPVPVVLATAFADGTLVQWGGRYLLGFGVTMTVVGVGWLREHASTALVFAAILSLGVSSIGAVWTIDRSHGRGADLQTVLAEQGDGEPIIWRDSLLAREFGAESIGQAWASAPFIEEQQAISPLLRERGVESFLWVARSDIDLPQFTGYESDGTRIDLPATRNIVMRFRLS